MALFIKEDTDSNVISYDEYVEYLTDHVDFDDQQSIINSSYMMQSLCRNTDWFYSLLNGYLQKQNPYETSDNPYPSNSIVVKNDDPRYVLRINIWFPDSTKYSDEAKKILFAVNFPHDHDFDLLTTGLYGDGYTSDFYLYDSKDAELSLNESVKIVKKQKYKLSSGSTLFMAANKDIHDQTLPQNISASFNLLIRRTSGRQYLFKINDKEAVVTKVFPRQHKRIDRDLLNLIQLSNGFDSDIIIKSLREHLSEDLSPEVRDALIERLNSVPHKNRALKK